MSIRNLILESVPRLKKKSKTIQIYSQELTRFRKPISQIKEMDLLKYFLEISYSGLSTKKEA